MFSLRRKSVVVWLLRGSAYAVSALGSVLYWLSLPGDNTLLLLAVAAFAGVLFWIAWLSDGRPSLSGGPNSVDFSSRPGAV